MIGSATRAAAAMTLGLSGVLWASPQNPPRQTPLGIVGSHDIRGPLVDMLNRIVAPNDLFGVVTSKMNPSSLVLGRKQLSVEEQLTRYWPWGERSRLGHDPDDDKEDYLSRCCDNYSVGDQRPGADDEGVGRAISDILIGASADLFTYGIVSGRDLVVVGEIASGQVEMGKWLDGGTMTVVITGPAGEQVGTATGRIEAGSRGALVRVPFGLVAGPWRAAVTVTGTSGSLGERLDVRMGSGRLLADPILYRGTGAVRAVLRPVADFLYHRTERVHVEFPVLKPLDQRTSRVLDRRGQPLPVAATLTERDDAGQTILAADLNLAQLSPGDYALEVAVASGALKQTRQVAVRVVR